MDLQSWADRWGIPRAALIELAGIPVLDPVDGAKAGSEAAVQAGVRLEAARAGWHVFRNNVGALIDETGRAVRYGLANDSKAVNARLKSADLIGWKSHKVQFDDIGKTVAIFVSRECKRSGWRYSGTPEEAAQLRWHSMILAAGGDSAIVNSTGSIK